MKPGAATFRLGFTLAALALASTVSAQSGRLLTGSSVTERSDHLDLAIEFACTMPYRTHAPAAQGDRVRITLAIGPDCPIPGTAQFATEFLMPADARDLVRSIELQPGLAGGAELIVSWNRIEQYVLAPASGMRGVRIRIQRRSSAQVLIDEPAEPTADYAVNLESSREPFEELAVAAAGALLQAPVYVSEVDVQGVHWYRLRSGPFATRREAGEIQRRALARYPNAWLAIGDEAQITPEEAATRIAPTGPSGQTETRTDTELDRQLDTARADLNARRNEDAVRSLTQIVAAEDYVRRSEAAELLGLARERLGQLAQAKAVYEDFLRRYPQSPAAGRIRERLQALRLADIPGRAGTRAGQSQLGWSAWGNAQQTYRRDDSHLDTAGTSRDVTTQNAVLTDVDGLLRRRGERFDFTARSSLGYMKDLQPAGRENRLRVSSMYAEVGDRSRSLNARLGRQSRGMAGVNGIFDGLLTSWQAKPRLGGSLVVGAPVESTRGGPDFERRFVGGALDFAGRDHRWEASAFALAQQYAGHTDRRSLGLEARYLQPGRTLVAMTDYDVFFGELNAAMLIGTLITDSRWTFNLDAGMQRSPQLTIRNALIGQPTLVFDELYDRFSAAEIEQLALDRSAKATHLAATASHPLGDRGQWTFNVSSFDLSGTPASGDVAAVPSPGREDAVSTELLFNSLMRAGDTHSFALRAQRGDSGTLVSAGLGSRLPLGSHWRLTTRLRVDHRSITSDDSRNWIWAPSFRVEYQHRSATFELEAGAELSRRTGATTGTDKSLRRYISAGYRLYLNRSGQ